MRDIFYAGIDPSITNTGLVILDGFGNLACAHDCGAGISKKSASDVQRYLEQARHVADVLANYNIVKIAYEDYSYNSTHRAYSLAEFGGVLKAGIFQRFGLHPVFVAPKRLKKFAAGNGAATKDMMRREALSECGKFSGDTSYDICDAYFLAKYALYLSDTDNARKIDRGNKRLRARLETILKKDNNDEY